MINSRDTQDEAARGKNPGGNGGGHAPESLSTSDESAVPWHAYWEVLVSRWWVIASVTAAIFLGAALYTFRAVPLYRGTTRILIEQSLPRVLESQDVYQLGDPYDFYQTQYRLLESRRIAERTVERLNLFEDPELRKAADPVGAFMGCLRIQPVRNSRLVDIEVDRPKPEQAAAWADAIAAEYIADTLDRRQKTEREALAELTKEVEPLRKRLEEQERATQAFREEKGLVSINERQSLLERRLEELSTATTSAEKERRDLEATIERISAILKQEDTSALFSLPRIQSSVLCQKIQEDQVRLMQEREDLTKTYKERHPKLLAVDSKLVGLENSLKREAGRIVAGTQAGYDEALSREKKSKEALEEAKREKVLFDRDLIALSQLQREADATRTLYENLLKRIQETKVTSSMELTNVTVVDKAQIPNEPVSPRVMLNLLLGLLGGLAAGVAAAFLVEQVDNTVDTPEKLERMLGSPLLGVVPRVEMNGASVDGERGKVFGEAEADAGSVPGGNGTSTELICLRDAKSLASEAYRGIRTAVQFAGSAGRAVRSIAVVSTVPREGKTLTAVNLAIAMAQAGHRVLIIDADMRKPRLHKVLCPGLTHVRGLSNVLIGAATLDDVARETPVAGLWCVPAGPIPPNPSELLGSPRMADLLRAAHDRFDRIIVDSPPVGAVTDACVFAPHLDGVVQVVGFGSTSRNDARMGKDRLVSLGACYLGAVLNNVPAARWRLGRSGMGRYYNRYGSYYETSQD